MGQETQCKIQIDEALTVKKVIETDLLERIKDNGVVNSDAKLDGNTVSFTIKPYEIKSILCIGRIIVEEEEPSPIRRGR